MPNLLNSITSQLKSFFGGTTRTAKEKVGDLSSFFQNFSQRNNGVQIKDTATQPSPSPTIQQQPSPTPRPDNSGLQQQIESGLNRFSSPPPPIATLSAQLAQAGQQLPPTVNPLLPTILALMESRGLQDPRPAASSNPYNIMAPDLVQYQDPGQAILGGNGKLGLMGLLREGGLYQDFRNTGDISTFFNRFTPASDPLNPSNDQLVERYNTLLQLFQ